ncbi:MAG: hypothetical protein K0Q90_2226 [Paenibacillaceae bacterium]|jgi:hypothetical protein|nr:hypothetical protein [Paenibacillaceae bacterium]
MRTSFLNGFFGDKRPLTGMEISGLYSSMELVLLKEAISTGFAQVSTDHKVKEQFLRMKELAEGHKEAMEKVLEKDVCLPPFPVWRKSPIPPRLRFRSALCSAMPRV